MSGRTFIITLGFHEDHAIRRLLSCGATKEDRIYLITAKPKASAVERAYEGIVSVTKKVGLSKPELIELPQEPAEGVKTIAEILEKAENIVFDLSGGMRYLTIYSILALIITKKKAKIYVQPEGSEEKEIEIPEAAIQIITSPVTEAEVNTLKLINDNEGISPEELAKTAGKALKTINNILTSLNKKGLIFRKGRRGGIYITSWGRLVIELTKLK